MPCGDGSTRTEACSTRLLGPCDADRDCPAVSLGSTRQATGGAPAGRALRAGSPRRAEPCITSRALRLELGQLLRKETRHAMSGEVAVLHQVDADLAAVARRAHRHELAIVAQLVRRQQVRLAALCLRHPATVIVDELPDGESAALDLRQLAHRGTTITPPGTSTTRKRVQSFSVLCGGTTPCATAIGPCSTMTGTLPSSGRW